MLPKKARLTRKDFDRFFAFGTRVHTPFFTVVYTPHPTFHASVVVGKKVAAKAVARNKLRRRIYHILRDVARARTKEGVFIVLTKKDARVATPSILRESLERMLGGIEKTR